MRLYFLPSFRNAKISFDRTKRQKNVSNINTINWGSWDLGQDGGRAWEQLGPIPWTIPGSLVSGPRGVTK